MKKRYLVPLIYLIAWPLAFLFQSDGLMLLLWLPTNLVLLTIEVYFFSPGTLTDEIILPVLLQLGLYFLVGFGLDRFSEWLARDLES